MPKYPWFKSFQIDVSIIPTIFSLIWNAEMIEETNIRMDNL